MASAITDWDDAYNNRAHAEGVDEMVAAWAQSAADFREQMVGESKAKIDLAYGESSRNVMDIFKPGSDPAGLVIFVHGGYWRAFDKTFWSHLARGPLSHNWSVAMPSYTLAPDAQISEITAEVRKCLMFLADRYDGPIRLIGHSAGGHLVSRMVCSDQEIPREIFGRIEHVVSLSGVHDLRPLLYTKMNDDFKMDLAAASNESPALQVPNSEIRLTCVAGAEERPEFVRQNALLANIWTGFGVDVGEQLLPGLNHFTVVEQLENPESELVRILLG